MVWESLNEYLTYKLCIKCTPNIVIGEHTVYLVIILKVDSVKIFFGENNESSFAGTPNVPAILE